MSVQTQIDRIAGNVSEQNGLIQQIKTGLTETAENLARANNEISTQSVIIQQIQESLEGKAVGGGGVVAPVIETLRVTANGTYTAPKGVDGYSPVTVNVPIPSGYIKPSGTLDVKENGMHDIAEYASVNVNVPIPDGYIKPSGTLDVTKNGVYDVSEKATVDVNIPESGGFVVKSGTTTSRTIDTGLSEIEQFFMYKETQTGTGLIRLHYTKTATSRMYASAWSTQNYGTKTITNGTGGVTVNGGSITISATNATQGGLTSNTTYKWVAVGKE